jgi:hypothetical protein
MYATGSAANPSALLTALEAFAVSAGWTIDRTTSVYNPGGGGGPSDYWLAMHKGTCYLGWYFALGLSGVILYPADGWNGASAPGAQASVIEPATQTYSNFGSGPYTGYHFFSTTVSGRNYLHVVIEISGGVFGQLHGGMLNAAGGATPALYSTGTKWNYGQPNASFPEDGSTNNVPWGTLAQSNGTLVLVTVDGVLGWQFMGGLAGVGHRILPAVRANGFQNRGLHRTPNGFNELAVLFPCHCFAERASGFVYSYIGEPWDMRACNIQNINPKDEITIGADVWKFFPAAAKSLPINVTNAPTSSGNYGYAFKKNA